MTLAWALGPFLAFSLLRPNVYDGTRHSLFLYPALALLVGWAGASMLRLCSTARAGWAQAAALTGALAWPLVPMAGLHPYEVTYFNGIVGGVSHAWRRFETDYWVASYREAALWINGDAAQRFGGRARVLIAANGVSEPCARRYLAPGITSEAAFAPGVRGELPARFDYYLATTRFGLAGSFSGDARSPCRGTARGGLYRGAAPVSRVFRADQR